MEPKSDKKFIVFLSTLLGINLYIFLGVGLISLTRYGGGSAIEVLLIALLPFIFIQYVFLGKKLFPQESKSFTLWFILFIIATDILVTNLWQLIDFPSLSPDPIIPIHIPIIYLLIPYLYFIIPMLTIVVGLVFLIKGSKSYHISRWILLSGINIIFFLIVSLSSIYLD